MTDRKINSRTFVQHLLGQRVVCTLTDGRTATGRLVCVDRL
jgi:small nuclear ribonucleoprotein (snRNP)-like protein